MVAVDLVRVRMCVYVGVYMSMCMYVGVRMFVYVCVAIFLYFSDLPTVWILTGRC
jgi:hypothetical protein